jgi:NADH-quinone oxidoreductase subunit C
MSELIQAAIAALQEKFQAESTIFRGLATVYVARENLIEACRILRDEYSFGVLTDETAVDYWRRKEPRFEINYQLHNRSENLRIFLRTRVPEDDPVLPSLVDVYPNANWYEREIWDLFGIRFEGHPDLRRLLLPKDWEGHPLRKDQPIKMEETRFSFNYKNIDDGKPRVKRED